MEKLLLILNGGKYIALSLMSVLICCIYHWPETGIRLSIYFIK